MIFLLRNNILKYYPDTVIDIVTPSTKNEASKFIPELNKSVNIKLSVKAIKIVDKLGLIPYLKKQGLTLADIT